MFVLGIDPGLSRCGYGCVDAPGPGQRPRAVAAGVLRTDRYSPHAERLAALASDIEELLDDLCPAVVVVERVLFQTARMHAMGVNQAAGLAQAAAARRGLGVAEYSSNEVKLAVTGYGAASKEQVSAMVTSLLGLALPPTPPDAADALALALCHAVRSPLLNQVAT